MFRYRRVERAPQRLVLHLRRRIGGGEACIALPLQRMETACHPQWQRIVLRMALPSEYARAEGRCVIQPPAEKAAEARREGRAQQFTGERLPGEVFTDAVGHEIYRSSHPPPAGGSKFASASEANFGEGFSAIGDWLAAAFHRLPLPGKFRCALFSDPPAGGG